MKQKRMANLPLVVVVLVHQFRAELGRAKDKNAKIIEIFKYALAKNVEICLKNTSFNF